MLRVSLPMILLAAVVPISASCSAGHATSAAGDDGKDDRAELQREIDRLAAQGGGVLQLESGVYDLALPLYLRSGVKIVGRGRSTVLSSKRLNDRKHWFGTTVFGGNLTPGNFSNDRNEGYVGRPARKANGRSLTIADCRPNDLPAVGEVVWLSSREAIRGVGDRRRPVYGELTQVKAVQGCRVDIADAAEVPGDEILLHWSDRSRFLPGGNEPNAPIRDAGLSNLTLEAGEGTALIASGCYRCDFTGIHFARTMRLIGAQGQRHVRFKDITGDFRWRGIEVVMYARDVLIENVDAELRDQVPDVRPAIRFGEYARDNIVRNIRLRLGNGYTGRGKIRFHESADNRLENVELIVAQPERRSEYMYKPRGAQRADPGAVPEGTVIQNVRICVEGNPQACEPLG